MWDVVALVFRIKQFWSNLFRTWSNISLKVAEPLVKTFHVIRGASFAYRFYRFNHNSTSLCFVDDLCQILGMFSLNSIGCVTKCGPAGILEGNTTDRCVRPTCSNLHTKDLSNILTARWRASAWSDKMNKEQSADDPSVDLIRVKNMLNSTISMSYPDVVIACIEHKVSLEAFRAIEAALVKR